MSAILKSSTRPLFVAALVIIAAGGTVAHAQPPVVSTNVVNTPNVTVVNTQPVPVTLGNGAINVQPAQIPYSVDATPSSSGGSCSSAACFINFPVVPAGKTLVITYINSIARASAVVWDQLELVTSNTQDPNIGVRVTMGYARIGLAGSSVISDTYGAGGPILAFARAGTAPRATVSTRDGGANSGFVFTQVTISGYLIPAQ
jgi:hypothetical protein